MFIRYATDMKSWILFVLALLGLTDLLIFLDNGIAVRASSILYLNLLFLLAFAGFLLWRFRRETEFTEALSAAAEAADEDWVAALPAVRYFRDETTRDLLRAAARRFSLRQSESHTAGIAESDYTASWVHEAKAPLTAMKMAIDASRSDPAMRKIEAEWLRLHLLIDRQLYITRLPSLEADYVLEAADIGRLAAKEVRELASWCVEKNIAVEFEGGAAEVVTDSKWCRFIIRQLLTNAVKYSPAGGTITLTTEIAQTGNVMLTIQDEGPGIPAHDLPRVFDKGFTGDNGRLQNAATGLGLYLAQSAAGKIGIRLAVLGGRPKGTAVRMAFTVKNGFQSVRT